MRTEPFRSFVKLYRNQFPRSVLLIIPFVFFSFHLQAQGNNNNNNNSGAEASAAKEKRTVARPLPPPPPGFNPEEVLPNYQAAYEPATHEGAGAGSHMNAANPNSSPGSSPASAMHPMPGIPGRQGPGASSSASRTPQNPGQMNRRPAGSGYRPLPPVPRAPIYHSTMIAEHLAGEGAGNSPALPRGNNANAGNPLAPNGGNAGPLNQRPAGNGYQGVPQSGGNPNYHSTLVDQHLAEEQANGRQSSASGNAGALNRRMPVNAYESPSSALGGRPAIPAQHNQYEPLSLSPRSQYEDASSAMRNNGTPSGNGNYQPLRPTATPTYEPVSSALQRGNNQSGSGTYQELPLSPRSNSEYQPLTLKPQGTESTTSTFNSQAAGYGRVPGRLPPGSSTGQYHTPPPPRGIHSNGYLRPAAPPPQAAEERAAQGGNNAARRGLTPAGRSKSAPAAIQRLPPKKSSPAKSTSRTKSELIKKGIIKH